MVGKVVSEFKDLGHSPHLENLYLTSSEVIELHVVPIKHLAVMSLLICAWFFALTVNAPSAVADTLGYPNPDVPCEHAPYNVSGTCANYDWGPTHTEKYDDPSEYSNRGYAYRNCTDYVAWKLQSIGVSDSKTRGLGNGGQWYDDAPSSERSSSPLAGDAAIEPGTVGHVAYIETVNSVDPANPLKDNITVSEYNYAGTGVGDMRTGTPSSLGLTEFIDFGVHPATGSSSTRIAFVDVSGDAYIKDGGLNKPFTKIWDHASSTAAADIQLSPNRIAIDDINGNVYVNQYPITTSWVLVASAISVNNYRVTDGNIGVLDSVGNLKVKQGTGYGSLSNGWHTAGVSVSSFRMSQNGNIAAVFTNGTMYVAWGGYGSAWTAVATNFLAYDINNGDIAVVFSNNILDVMVGAPVNNIWHQAMTSAVSVQLAVDNNLAGVDTSGYLNVAWGGYGSAFTPNVANAYKKDQITDTQLGVLYGHELKIKEGSASVGWTTVTDAAANFALS